jgi:hypothetical protein
MLPTDNLVSEAVKMGQQVAQMTGQLFAKKPVKGMPGKFYVIALNFYGQEDFQVLAKTIEKLQLVGFDEKDFGTIVQTAVPGISNDVIVPKCRIHGKPMKPGKKPGQFFCPRMLADGTYCEEVKNV